MQPIKRSRLSPSSSLPSPSSLMDIVGAPPPPPQQNPHLEGTVEWYTFEIKKLEKEWITEGGKDPFSKAGLLKHYVEQRDFLLKQQQPRTLLFFRFDLAKNVETKKHSN
jgi:hypothetical protein